MRNLTGPAVRLPSVALIVAAVCLAYFNAIHNGFVYDDVTIIELNPLIRSWDNLGTVLTTGYWEPIGSTDGLYRPLTMLTYMAEYAFFGMDPRYFHLGNITLHAACSVLVYLLARRTTSNEGASVIAALLFALHPVHVEAVANTVGRAELLASLFTLLGFYIFIAAPRRLPWYIVSPLLMFAGLLSKETAIVLPVLILAYILLFERGGRGRSLKTVALTLLPFAVVTGIVVAIRLNVLTAGIYPHYAGQTLACVNNYCRVLLMAKVFMRYIWLSVLPTHLYVFYMLRPPVTLLDSWVIAFAGAFVVFAAVSVRHIRDGRMQFFYAVWFPIALLPVSNLVPIGMLMSERAMYLPSVSVCVLGGLLFSWLGAGRAMHGGATARAATVILAVLLASFWGITHERNHVWHDSVSFDSELVRAYAHVAEDFPESGKYYYHMSKTLHELGHEEEAEEAAKQAIAIEPFKPGYHVQLAQVYVADSKFALALPEVMAAARLDENPGPDQDALFAEVFYMQGMEAEYKRYLGYLLSSDPVKDAHALTDIASCLYEMHMYKEAERYIRQALELNPYIWQLHLNLAYIFKHREAYDEALAELDKAVELNSRVPELYYERGMIYGIRHMHAEAVEDMEKAVWLKPDSPEFRYMLAVAYIGDGRHVDATRELQEALRLRPGYERARRLLEQKNIMSSPPS